MRYTYSGDEAFKTEWKEVCFCLNCSHTSPLKENKNCSIEYCLNCSDYALKKAKIRTVYARFLWIFKKEINKEFQLIKDNDC